MGTGATIGIGTVLAAFAAGLLSFFSPCVAPLMPGYIGYLSGSSLRAPDEKMEEALVMGRRVNPALAPCLLFVAGFSLAFIALGIASASAGRLIAAYQPVLETIVGIVLLVMGAFLLNLLPRPVMELFERERRLHLSAGRAGKFGALAPVALGVVFAAGWTPCIGPVLASILLVAGTSGQVGAGFLLLLMYSIGFALPFLAVGLGWSVSLRVMGWLRRHGRAVSIVTGVALMAFGILYLTGWVTVFSQWAPSIRV
jgi:cytochrome c-type biogenesis protein